MRDRPCRNDLLVNNDPLPELYALLAWDITVTTGHTYHDLTLRSRTRFPPFPTEILQYWNGQDNTRNSETNPLGVPPRPNQSMGRHGRKVCQMVLRRKTPVFHMTRCFRVEKGAMFRLGNRIGELRKGREDTLTNYTHVPTCRPSLRIARPRH
jgi:hypothetical protein